MTTAIFVMQLQNLITHKKNVLKTYKLRTPYLARQFYTYTFYKVIIGPKD